MADADAFLRKARESLDSAEDDLARDRYNACARNAYYAAFQAAVAALIAQGIRPVSRWEHEFVQARFSGMLVRRRKIYPGRVDVIVPAYQLRARADYSPEPVSRRQVNRIIEGVRRLLSLVKGQINGGS